MKMPASSLLSVGRVRGLFLCHDILPNKTGAPFTLMCSVDF